MNIQQRTTLYHTPHIHIQYTNKIQRNTRQYTNEQMTECTTMYKTSFNYNILYKLKN
jgi:hypothetical protein